MTIGGGSAAASPVSGEAPIIGGYRTRAVRLDALQVEVLVVDRLEEYVDAAALLRDGEAAEPPYWAHLWPGSRVLARLMATAGRCARRRVLDIGCGIGVAAIVAARHGAVVTALDAAHPALLFAGANAVRNGCRLHLLQADLRCVGLRGTFDCCLAADVTYDPALQRALAEFLANHLAPGGHAWCAESVRTFDREFHRACTARGLSVGEHEVREPDDGREVVVRVSEIRRV